MKNFTGRNFEGRSMRFFAFGSLLVPPQTLYLSIRIFDLFDRKLDFCSRKFRIFIRKESMDEALNFRIRNKEE